jgi:hypothetical protein
MHDHLFNERRPGVAAWRSVEGTATNDRGTAIAKPSITERISSTKYLYIPFDSNRSTNIGSGVAVVSPTFSPLRCREMARLEKPGY